ncbi:dTDP-4-dehydrorhamnose reductase [Chryseolinea sp. T2]|uniref:dTDP-4-dehydrorhamnose reductase n=1 Tax=Chryseolinea sp. T2 TaxID=3129255 RepID=UPI003076DB36
MKILVTGANGQLGSELRELSSSRTSDQFTFVDIAEMDLASDQAMHDFFDGKQFDFVINCAAYTAVDKAEEDSALAYRINAGSVKTLAGICKKKAIRLIHISTDYVFDGEGNLPISEDAVPRPLSVYGKSKLEGERHVLDMLDNAYVIRTAWVYSTFGKNFVKTIAKLAKERESLNVVSDQVGSPTYARNLAAVVLSIVDKVHAKEVDIPGVYHFSDEGVISWYDFAWFIAQTTGARCRINAIPSEEYPTPAVRPRFSVLDKRKIKKNFGISPPYWYDSLKECLSKLDH